MPENTNGQSKSIHGVLLSVFGRGVLLRGESGIGKSLAALGMIDRGHQLVADDSVSLNVVDGELVGSSPGSTRGMLFVPGLPFIDIAGVFGNEALLAECRIDLCLDAELQSRAENPVSAADVPGTIEFLGVSIPLFRIEVPTAGLPPVLIECAVRSVFNEPDASVAEVGGPDRGSKTFHI